MTNFDKIKNLSVEEFVDKFIFNDISKDNLKILCGERLCNFCISKENGFKDCGFHSCRNGIIEYFKSEAKETDK